MSPLGPRARLEPRDLDARADDEGEQADPAYIADAAAACAGVDPHDRADHPARASISGHELLLAS
jgi:hypothetical protein